MDFANIDLNGLTQILILYGLNLFYAIAILVVGWWISGRVKAGLERAFARVERMDVTVAHFLAGLARYFVIAVVIIAVLQLFGIETTSLIAVLGAASLAIGLALQGTLSNVAAGVMLLIMRPIRIGHFVDIGEASGTVKNVSLFTTELTTFDGIQKIVPNSEIWGSTITNFSANPTRWIQIDVGIDYDADIGVAIDTLMDVIRAEPRVLAEPAPVVVVMGLGASSVDLQIRAWASRADFWATKFDLTRRTKEALDAAGIGIPFPQVTLTQKGAMKVMSETAAGEAASVQR